MVLSLRLGIQVMDEVTNLVTAIARRLATNEVAAELEDPDRELSTLGFDSLKIVAFIVELEKNFSIEFPADMIDAETFHSVSTVAAAVRMLRER
jgi:acyl carrier protein